MEDLRYVETYAWLSFSQTLLVIQACPFQGSKDTLVLKETSNLASTELALIM